MARHFDGEATNRVAFAHGMVYQYTNAASRCREEQLWTALLYSLTGTSMLVSAKRCSVGVGLRSWWSISATGSLTLLSRPGQR